MIQMAIDPIGYSEALQADGLPKAAADRIARSQEAMIDTRVKALRREWEDESGKRLATKADLAEMELRMTKSFHDTLTNTLYGFAGIMVAAIAAAAAITIAILKP